MRLSVTVMCVKVYQAPEFLSVDRKFLVKVSSMKTNPQL